MRMAARGAALCLTLVAAAGCENRIPTATGDGLFPEGATPATVQLELSAAEFIVSDTVFDDFNDARDVPYLVVANRFDGALDAYGLAQFTGFPDSVTYTSGSTTRTEAQFTYAPSQVVARVDSATVFPRTPTTLRLYALRERFDSATVSFAAVRQLGPLLGEAVYTPGDTLRRDSVVFQLDSLTVRRLASPDFPGVAVTSATPNSRLQLGRLSVQLRIRPGGQPDTVLTRAITTGPQTFVVSPPPPRQPGVLRVGGLTQARSVLRLNLDRQVPACPRPATTPNCGTVPLREVTVDRAELLFAPVPVPLGYRPTAPTQVLLRRLVEPELGRRAPLGEVLATDTASANLFAGPTQRTLSLNITQALVRVVTDTSATVRSTPLPVALLTASEIPNFGYLWFAGAPRLRILYTLPQRPTLP